MKAVREDETAAEAMGINAFWTKNTGLCFQRIFSKGWRRTPGSYHNHYFANSFHFMLTFNLLIIIVIGGLGSTTGAVIAAVLITWGGELLRFVEEPMTVFGYDYEGIPGMRMVIFSFLLIFVMLFARSGLMGRHEFSWQSLIDCVKALGPPFAGTGMKGPLLDIRKLSVAFGGLSALNGLDLQISEGEIIGSSAPTARARLTLSTPSPLCQSA